MKEEKEKEAKRKKEEKERDRRMKEVQRKKIDEERKKEREEKCINFICLRDCKASTTPTPKEEAYLTQIGLGMKKLPFTSTMTEEEVHYDFCW